CELAGRRDMPVFAGCAQPLQRPLRTATAAHGETGMNGATLPEPEMTLQPRHAVDWLIERVMASDNAEITICAIGPLTNLATAFRREPRMAGKLREVVIMGGAGENFGNVTPAAEFNILADPEAAAVVFAGNCPITLVPLDLTQQVIVTRERLARIEKLGSRVGQTVTGLLRFYNGFDTGRVERESDALHDPCVIGYLLRPEIFIGAPVDVTIGIASDHALGQTKMDWDGGSGRAPNCTVLRKIDAEGFFQLLIERLARY
ncbi:MAG: nucleoside hydrolase, partial [Dongiaceae bacterium]